VAISRGQKPLTSAEIIALDKALIETFKLLSDIKEATPIARHIKFPALPSIFSESIIIAVAPKLFGLGPEWKAVRGGKAADILLIDGDGNKQRVEVKATAKQGVLELKQRDINSDRLVWIAFGFRYHNGSGPINIYDLANPHEYLDASSSRIRVTSLNGFLKSVQSTANLTTYTYTSLNELLEGSE
jgi:hypothetical protein